ncbi:ethylene-responsive transcription factor ERF026-like [Quercus lobata]|nr:ethylene-responsive transcription factor ERF026-like [Quercus lobata]
MAATAYDVAALALRGPNTVLNFPDLILWYPIPLSKSPVDIRAAAACAAEARMERSSESSSDHQETTHLKRTGEEHFTDEEELLNMPSLLVNMAEGMLLTPPRIQSKSSSDESGGDGNGDGDGDGLWSYAY